jgi:hypothetical protein
VRGAAFAGRDAAYDVRTVLDHLFCVESSLFAGDALNDQPRVLIN